MSAILSTSAAGNATPQPSLGSFYFTPMSVNGAATSLALPVSQQERRCRNNSDRPQQPKTVHAGGRQLAAQEAAAKAHEDEMAAKDAALGAIPARPCL